MKKETPEISEGASNLKLALFVRYVRAGRPISSDLLNYVADGVEEFLKGSKQPWTGRKNIGTSTKKQNEASKIYALSEIELSNERIADILGNNKGGGEDTTRTIRRKIKTGKEFKKNCDIGLLLHIWAIEELLENPQLKREEIQKLRKKLEATQAEYDSDESEPNYE